MVRKDLWVLFDVVRNFVTDKKNDDCLIEHLLVKRSALVLEVFNLGSKLVIFFTDTRLTLHEIIFFVLNRIISRSVLVHHAFISSKGHYVTDHLNMN